MIPFLLNVIENIMEFKINKYGIKVPIRQKRMWSEDEIKWLVENNSDGQFVSKLYIKKNNKSYFIIQYNCKICCTIHSQHLSNFLQNKISKECKLYKNEMLRYDTVENTQKRIDLIRGEGYFTVYELIRKRTNSGKCCLYCHGIYEECKHIATISTGNLILHKYNCFVCKKNKIYNKLDSIYEELLLRGIKCSLLKEEFAANKTVSYITCCCVKCEHIWSAQFNTIFYKRTGCPKCKKSKGEQYFSNYLNSQQIKYEIQKTFDDCIYNKFKCRFDFYLPEFNLIVEIHGLQHQIEVNYFTRTLDEQKKVDDYKRQYCITNNINYLEIDYNHSSKDWKENLISRFSNYIKSNFER